MVYTLFLEEYGLVVSVQIFIYSSRKKAKNTINDIKSTTYNKYHYKQKIQ